MARSRNSDQIILSGDQTEATALLSYARSQFSARDRGTGPTFSTEFYHNGSRIYLQRQGINRKIMIDAGGASEVVMLMHLDSDTTLPNTLYAAKPSSLQPSGHKWAATEEDGVLEYDTHYGDAGFSDGQTAVSWTKEYNGSFFYRGTKAYYFENDGGNLNDNIGLYSVPASYDSNQFSGLIPLGGCVRGSYLFAIAYVEKYVDDIVTEFVEVIAIKLDGDVSGSVLFSETVYDPTIASPGENAYDNLSQSISGKKAFIFCARKYYLLEFSISESGPQVSVTEFEQPLSAYSGSSSDVQVTPYSPDIHYTRNTSQSSYSEYAGYVGAVWSLNAENVEQYDLIYASGYTQSSFSQSLAHDEDIHGTSLWTGSASKTARQLITATVDGVTHTVVDRTYSASVSFTDEPSTYDLQAAFNATASDSQTARKFIGGDRRTYVAALDSNVIADGAAVYENGIEEASVNGFMFNASVGLGETLLSTFVFIPTSSTTPAEFEERNFSNSSSDSGSVASPPVGLFLDNDGLVSSIRDRTLVSLETGSGDILNHASGEVPFADILPDGVDPDLLYAPLVQHMR